MDFEKDSPEETQEVSTETSREGGEDMIDTAPSAMASDAKSKVTLLNERLGLETEPLDDGQSNTLKKADDFEEMMAQYEETLQEIKAGTIVKGTIIHVGESEAQVNVGFKSEGYIPVSEFGGRDSIEVGQEMDVFLESLEDEDGLVVLSKEKADFLKVWDKIKEGYDAGETMSGTVDRRIKGGLVVKFMGVEAFLPGSQVALRQVPDLEALLGQTFDFKIIKLNKRRRNIVVSRRVVLEAERNKLKAKLIEELEKGQVRSGTVKNITDFGAFVDLGGIDGLLHLTDMSWGRLGHPSEVVNIGDTIEVKILEIDLDRERISLGLKQLSDYPWENVEDKYPINGRVQGKVVSITDYGAFVELEKGVEGLVHISEMSWTRHVKHPSKVVTIGQDVEAMVLAVDRENEKISLGLKQTEPDPWDTLDEKYPLGSIVHGSVRNLTNFGAFVELEEGIDGLVHISDMSWTKRIHHPREILSKGDEIEVAVLDIDKSIRRISLGLKQLTPDPWFDLTDKYTEGTFVDAKVSRPLERGVVVEVEDGVEGFIPVSHLGERSIKKPQQHFAEGESVPAKVIKVDHDGRRIVLSITDRLSEEGEEARAEFMEKFGAPRFTEAIEESSEPAADDEAKEGDASEPAAEDPAATEEAEATSATDESVEETVDAVSAEEESEPAPEAAETEQAEESAADAEQAEESAADAEQAEGDAPADEPESTDGD